MNTGTNISLILQIANIVLVVIIIPMVKYIFAREVSSIEEKIKRNNDYIEEIHKKLTENVDALQKDFQCFKEKVAEDYLKKRDFNGMVSDITKKLDKLYDIILEMRGNAKNG